MRKYMVTVRLPQELDDSFWLQIPAHREMIVNLMQKDIIINYAINYSRTTGWIVINGESKEDVLSTVKKFPIYSYYLDVTVDELFLFDTSAAGLPKLIMN